jgi:hypothetical protein
MVNFFPKYYSLSLDILLSYYSLSFLITATQIKYENELTYQSSRLTERKKLTVGEGSFNCPTNFIKIESLELNT